ncbi:MAG TPA: GNAT family N-acetyltransferase [Gemmatimonadota bacterium]|nr:GNAT family N-acetyltransferase [Gemmatimonadota bacterium]
MSLTIRAARAADADVIAEFNRRLASESEGRELDPDTLARGVAALLSDPTRGQYWVAEDEGEPVGQCLVTTEWSDWTNGRYWWFQSVYVAPEWRGRRVFRALWDHVESSARKEGDVASLRLYVERDNTSARAVYEKLGMEQTGYLVYEKWLIDR